MTANPLEPTDLIEVRDGDPYDAETIAVEVDKPGPVPELVTTSGSQS